MKHQTQKINSQEELDSLLNNIQEGDSLDCFVQLNYGLRGSKAISSLDNGDYYILNEVDDSEEIIEHNKLMDSFIGKAMKDGALYKW